MNGPAGGDALRAIQAEPAGPVEVAGRWAVCLSQSPLAAIGRLRLVPMSKSVNHRAVCGFVGRGWTKASINGFERFPTHAAFPCSPMVNS